jgi:aryl carrier-like protein
MLVKGGVHYNLSFYAGETLVSKGNPKAPVCTDCHGFHMVGPRTTYETLSGIPCRKCHEDVFQIYAKSVHGMARAKGEHRAPLCASCHFAHEIRFTAMTDKIKTACLGCHTGIEGVHKKWLPNAELHLSVVACAACHAPASEKGIYLQLVDQKTERPFTQEQILQLLGTTSEELSWRLNVHGQGLDSYELSYFLKQLNERGAGARVTYLGRMDVSKYSEAHQLSLKKNAIRECESCHRKESKFFKRVTLAVIKTEGGMERYPVEPDVLTSIISTLSSRQFYVLGGTRIAFLDWAGIFVVFCGLLFPVAHITIRVLTAPLRKARKSKVPGKGEK